MALIDRFNSPYSTLLETNHAAPSVRGLKFKILPAPEALQEYVECFRSAEFSGEEELAIKVSVNGLPGIVFQHHQGQSPVEDIITPTMRNSFVPTLYLYGQITEPSVMNHKKVPFKMTQVLLKPHALKALLGMDAQELTNGAVELSELSAGNLNDRLVEARNEPERIALLAGFLFDRLKRARTRDRLVEEGLRLIHRHPGTITVRILVERLNISERQFERRFSQTVGVSPRFYMRVRRFIEAVRLMKSGQFEKLTDIAYALNYYDQSHFIRDIRTFSGLAPKRLSQREGFLHDQAGYSYL